MGICTHTTDHPERETTTPHSQRHAPSPNKISRHAATRPHDLVIQITSSCTLNSWMKHARNPDLAPAGTAVQSQCVSLSFITSTSEITHDKLGSQLPATWCSCSQNMRDSQFRTISKRSSTTPAKTRTSQRGVGLWQDRLKEKNLHLLAKVKVPKNRGSVPLARTGAEVGSYEIPVHFQLIQHQI